ncbi:MAG: YraN family protein [Pseudomonadota bacterium]
MTARAARGRSANLHGAAAEDVAERLYTSRGADVLARRMRNEAGEIDLILREGEVIVFVEVKARRGRGAAATALGPAQQARLGAAAEIWLAEHAPGAEMRFDVVLTDRSGAAEIIENALSFDGC